MSLHRRLRDRIYQRDGGICLICYHERLERWQATSIHHIVPKSQFGRNERELRDDERNLMAVCSRCHNDKLEAHDRVVELLRLMHDVYGYEYPEEKFRPWGE